MQQLHLVNEELLKQVEDLSIFQQNSDINSESEMGSSFFLPLTPKNSDCSVFQAVDVLYEEELTGRSKV